MAENNKESKIFIVEDDVDLSEMLSAYLRVQGYDVTQATRGEEAVSKIKEISPDLVVLDIRLPDIDGYEVCRRLRQFRRTQTIPVIFLTEKREREDKLAGLELGAVDYITKPFDIQELRLRIRNALRRSKMSTMHNPVTGLPEGVLVLEQLERMLQRPNWGIVLAGIRGLNKFRDRFGFVATDDVSRAVTLMLANAVQESGNENDFIGHADSGDFIIVTTADRCKRLAERCLVRLQPSIQYFYPAMERSQLNNMPDGDRLTVEVSSLSADEHQVEDVEALHRVLARQP